MMEFHSIFFERTTYVCVLGYIETHAYCFFYAHKCVIRASCKILGAFKEVYKEKGEKVVCLINAPFFSDEYHVGFF